MVNGIVLEGVSKKELLSELRIQLSDHFLTLLTTAEAADLLGVNVSSITRMKTDGRLTDYSRNNEHRKFAVSEVLAIRRQKHGK